MWHGRGGGSNCTPQQRNPHRLLKELFGEGKGTNLDHYTFCLLKESLPLTQKFGAFKKKKKKEKKERTLKIRHYKKRQIITTNQNVNYGIKRRHSVGGRGFCRDPLFRTLPQRMLKPATYIYIIFYFLFYFYHCADQVWVVLCES